MSQYKILEPTEIEGVEKDAGTIIELTEEQAAQLLADGKIEVVPEGGGNVGQGTAGEGIE